MEPLFRLRPGVRLILASASPRRKELLASLGVNFEVISSPVAETNPAPGEAPVEYALRMAKLKGEALAGNGALVIAADTVVSLGSMIYGKPKNSADAIAMLANLNGKTHAVSTAVYVGPADNPLFYETTQVVFGHFSLETLTKYAECGEPLDKAGAYAIQGRGSFLVERIMGSHSNVIGLPLEQLTRRLIVAGILS